jgi:hypothetical protein
MSPPGPAQERLLPYENPFAKRMDTGFFKAVPKRPGVYFFRGIEGSVLYVGKAKCLRDRINSYRHAKPGQVGRKVIRMLHLMRELTWEVCESETAALLRENELLRQLRPPFNRQNTRPDTYYLIGIRLIGGSVRFRLTTRPKRQGDLLYGAFKGRGGVRRGYQALLRVLWAAQARAERWEFPHRLIRPAPAHLYSVAVPEEWHAPLKRFLAGMDDRLLGLVTLQLLENPSIPPFQYRVIQEDLETLQEFFLRTLARNRELKRRHGVRGRLIPQDRIDDLMVLDRERAGRV